MRDRLVELLLNAPQIPCVKGGRATGLRYQTFENISDHLLANGVTVQEWISVKDRLPDKHGDYLTYDPRYGDIEIYYYMGLGEWDHHRNGITDAEGHGFTHWMPLPQPPKGE